MASKKLRKQIVLVERLFVVDNKIRIVGNKQNNYLPHQEMFPDTFVEGKTFLIS